MIIKTRIDQDSDNINIENDEAMLNYYRPAIFKLLLLAE
jgi:hypothetical protein